MRGTVVDVSWKTLVCVPRLCSSILLSEVMKYIKCFNYVEEEMQCKMEIYSFAIAAQGIIALSISTCNAEVGQSGRVHRLK